MPENNDPFDGVWVDERALFDLHKRGMIDINRTILCLYLKEGAFTDEINQILIRTAVSMVCLKRTRAKITTDWCEGSVTTSFQNASLEAFSGLKFECELDIENKKSMKASFLIGNTLLERFREAAWYFEQAEKTPLKTSYFS